MWKNGIFWSAQRKMFLLKIIFCCLPCHLISSIVHTIHIRVCVRDYAYVIFGSVNWRSRFNRLNFTTAMTFAFDTRAETLIDVDQFRPSALTLTSAEKNQIWKHFIKYLWKVTWYIHLYGLVGNHLWSILDLQRLLISPVCVFWICQNFLRILPIKFVKLKCIV